jgi:hypothetical protein
LVSANEAIPLASAENTFSIEAFLTPANRIHAVSDGQEDTLFHSFPVEGRDGYLRSVHRAAAPGANYYVLVFAKGAFPPDAEQGPNTVDEDELREAVSKHWQIDEIRPAFIHANIPPANPDAPFQMPEFSEDDQGRSKLPAYLLTAHKTE